MCQKNLGITLFWGLCSKCKIPCFLPDFYPRLPAHPEGAARLTSFHQAFPADFSPALWTAQKITCSCARASTQWLQEGPQAIFPANSPIILLHESLASGKNVSPTPHNSKIWPCFPSGLYLQIWAQNLLTVQWGSGLFGRVLWLGDLSSVFSAPSFL